VTKSATLKVDHRAKRNSIVERIATIGMTLFFYAALAVAGFANALLDLVAYRFAVSLNQTSILTTYCYVKAMGNLLLPRWMPNKTRSTSLSKKASVARDCSTKTRCRIAPATVESAI
jgi:hypothetical protein